MKIETTKKKIIDIVVPTYNEEENILLVYDTITALFSKEERLKNYDYRIIFADNLSTDFTRDKIRILCSRDNRVAAIFNSTNVGYARSSFYAICQTSADAVILLSADLQEPPEIIPDFVDNWEKGSKVVCGIKHSSKESKIMFYFRQKYYNFLKSMSLSGHINQFNGYALYDKTFVDTLKKIDDPFPYLRGMVAELGPKISYVKYTQKERNYGRTHYKFWGLYTFAMHGITSSSAGILRFAAVGGFFTAIICVVISIITLITKLLYWEKFQLGMAALITGVFFIDAVILFYIGIIGEFIVNMNVRIMHHPLVIEEERINM